MDPAAQTAILITAIFTGLAGLITAIVTARSSASKNQVNNLNTTLKSINDSYDTMVKERERLLGEVQKLRAENKEMRKELDLLRKENKDLQEDNRKLRMRVRELWSSSSPAKNLIICTMKSVEQRFMHRAKTKNG